MSQVVCLLVILALAPAVYAQDYARDGVALSIGGAFALEDFDDAGLDFDNTGAAGAAISYRFHPHFAVEGHFEHTFDFKADTFVGFGSANVDVNVWHLTANVQAFLLTGRFQPYIEAGYGYGSAQVSVDTPFGSGDDDTDGGMGRAGIGMDSYVTENFVVALEGIYNFGTGDMDDFNYWSLGGKLRWRF